MARRPAAARVLGDNGPDARPRNEAALGRQQLVAAGRDDRVVDPRQIRAALEAVPRHEHRAVWRQLGESAQVGGPQSGDGGLGREAIGDEPAMVATPEPADRHHAPDSTRSQHLGRVAGDRRALRVTHQVDLLGTGHRPDVVDHPGELRARGPDDRVEPAPLRLGGVGAERRGDHAEALLLQRHAETRHGVGAVVEGAVHEDDRPRMRGRRPTVDRRVHDGGRARRAERAVGAVEGSGHVVAELLGLLERAYLLPDRPLLQRLRGRGAHPRPGHERDRERGGGDQTGQPGPRGKRGTTAGEEHDGSEGEK